MEIADFSARKKFGELYNSTDRKFVFLWGCPGNKGLGSWTWKGAVCYGYITRFSEEPIDRLYLFVPKTNRHKTKLLNTRDYLNWFINSEMFGEAFVTKDVDQGFEFGFEVDCSVDRALLYGAVQAFRLGFEKESFGWSYYQSLGYDPYMSWAMASSFSLSERVSGVHISRYYPTPADHTLMNARHTKLEAFYPGHRKPCDSKKLCEVASYNDCYATNGIYLHGWAEEYWANGSMRPSNKCIHCTDLKKDWGYVTSIKLTEARVKKLEKLLKEGK